MTPQELRNQASKWNRVDEISKMRANDGLSKEQVMRQEMANLLNTRPGMFKPAEQEAMRKFIKGDKIDTFLANIASKKPTIGAKQIWEVAKYGGLAGSAAQSSEVLKYTGMLAAARAAAGVAGKAGVLGAKGAKKLKTSSDIKEIKRIIAPRGQPKLPMSEKPAPITPKPTKPEAPAKISSPKPEPVPDTPTSIMQRYLAEEDARPINPSGKIKMTIGEPTKKAVGSLAKKPKKAPPPEKSNVSGQSQSKKITASEARARMREREVDAELERGSKALREAMPKR